MSVPSQKVKVQKALGVFRISECLRNHFIRLEIKAGFYLIFILSNYFAE